ELESARGMVDDLARHARLITADVDIRQKFADELGQSMSADPERDSCNRLREALRQFGLDPIDGPADEVARAVAASPIRDALLGRLSWWHYRTDALVKGSRPNPEGSAPPADAPVIPDRLERVIRSARQLSGGAYARWQGLLDRRDVPGLVAFAASPDG